MNKDDQALFFAAVLLVGVGAMISVDKLRAEWQAKLDKDATHRR